MRKSAGIRGKGDFVKGTIEDEATVKRSHSAEDRGKGGRK